MLNTKPQKRLEIYQNLRYALRPEVSNPSEGVISGWTKDTQKPDFLKLKISSKTKNTQKRLEICQN